TSANVCGNYSRAVLMKTKSDGLLSSGPSPAEVSPPVEPSSEIPNASSDEIGKERGEGERFRLRKEFPSLQSGFVFLENAGGSQVPACVADAIRDYMLT